MTYRGKVQGGLIRLDSPVDLPEGTSVVVSIDDRPLRKLTAREGMLKFAGAIDDLPSDLAENHDHYLHGLPKK